MHNNNINILYSAQSQILTQSAVDWVVTLYKIICHKMNNPGNVWKGRNDPKWKGPLALTQSRPMLRDQYFVQVLKATLQVLTAETFPKPSGSRSQCSFGYSAVCQKFREHWEIFRIFFLALNGWTGIKRFPVGFECGSFSRSSIYHQPKKRLLCFFYNIFPQQSKCLGITPIRTLFFGKTTPQCLCLGTATLILLDSVTILAGKPGGIWAPEVLSTETWFNWNLCVNKLRCSASAFNL